MSTPKKILVVDIEATCWRTRPPNLYPDQKNEIIEIGIASIDIKTKAIEVSRSILVKPVDTKISEFCTELTTLTPEFIEENGQSYETAMGILRRDFKSDRNIFASWGDYDRRSFEKNCKWRNVPVPFSNLNINVKALFAAKHGYTGGLAGCAKDLGITFEGTQHRGVDDARMTAKILQTLL